MTDDVVSVRALVVTARKATLRACEADAPRSTLRVTTDNAA